MNEKFRAQVLGSYYGTITDVLGNYPWTREEVPVKHSFDTLHICSLIVQTGRLRAKAKKATTIYQVPLADKHVVGYCDGKAVLDPIFI